MQTIGLIGGMSWESSAGYYEALNAGVEERMGGLNSAKTVMTSVNFAEVTALQLEERWDDVADILVAAAQSTERAGADFLMLATTTFHRVAEQVQDAIDIDVLHLGDVVAKACLEAPIEKVGFLGTTFAMQRTFFTDRIASHGLEVTVPDGAHHAGLDTIIYDELVHGVIDNGSRKTVISIIDEMWDTGIGGVILGCTELEQLVHQADVNAPVFGSTSLHVQAALDRALG